MIEILRKMFDANPEKSIIGLKDKCSECGREITVNISPTSGGFGLQGGALFKSSDGGYSAKCPDCYNLDRAKTDDTLSPLLSRVRSRRLRLRP